MRKTIPLVVLLSVLSVAQVPDQRHARHMHADEYAKVLDDPSRDAWQKPHEVLMALSLRKDEVVADIGAGTGYFARRFAHHAGTVYAVDIEPKLLEIAAKDAPPNLKTILAAPDDPKLSPKSVDTIFLCDVWHHIDNRVDYMGKLRTALKDDGRVVVVDFHKRALPVGPPPSMKVDRAEVIAEANKAGFRLFKEHSFLPHQYFLEFRK